MFQEIVLFGKTLNSYGFFNSIAEIGIVLWYLFHLKEYKSISTFPKFFEKKIGKNRDNFFLRWIFVLIEVVIIYAGLFSISKPIANLISTVFLGAPSDNYFYTIFAFPLIIIILSFIFIIYPLQFLDLAVAPMVFALIFYKIACFGCGCCFGVETEKFGMYNANTQRVDFPIQLVEIICAVIMFVIIMLLRHKKNRKPGILFPLFMLMYCASRFVSEFWRDDYPDVIGRLKGYHIQCIIGFVEGAILLFVILKWGDRITEFFTARKKKILERKSAETSEENASEE